MGVIAKKSLGQNFLNSPKAVKDILSAAKVTKGDFVLEIGPGKGALTKALLGAGAKVLAIEKDRELVLILKELFTKEIKKEKLEIVEGDVLLVDVPTVPYKLVANIPYYITGQVFRKFLEDCNGSLCNPTSITLLIQKEVAERIIVKDGKESILSISVKAYGKPKIISNVKRGSFHPIPNVDSAILHIGDISKEIFVKNKIKESLFFEIVKAAFAHKRKMIQKNIGQKGFTLPQEIDGKSRAEDLSLDDFVKIAVFNSAK